ncbi:MAG: hypothetical protein IJV51_07360 [Oscillospiraceae bacterium]|nr:hypothetical protein [Oscillospiraceae bacterium]
MKKLLALILCVMMFVSVIPTMAFATNENDAAETPAAAAGAANYTNEVDNPLKKARVYADEISDMIDNAKDTIEDAYAVLTMNQTVYAAAKGMDDTITGMVEALTNNLLGEEIYDRSQKKGYTFNEDDATAVKKAVRGLIDAKVAEKISKKESKYWDGEEFAPLVYAQVFADAVSDVLTDKDFQKGYQAVATYFAITKLVDDINDKLDDEYDDFKDLVAGTDFDNDFATNYPALAAGYATSFAAGPKSIPHVTVEDIAPWAAELLPSIPAVDPRS